MINISESGIDSLLPHSRTLLISHGRDHLRRVYPKGTRINSGNQDPAKQWRNGSHVACLNWQKYDRGTQLNEAMFVGTPGWVLKPQHMLGFGDAAELKPRRMKLVGQVVGVSACEIVSYILVVHLADCLQCRVPMIRCSSPRMSEFSLNTLIGRMNGSQNRLRAKQWIRNQESMSCGMNGSNSTTIQTNLLSSGEKSVLELCGCCLTFCFRILFKENEFGKDDKLAVFCAKLDHIQQGWRLVRLLDMHGKGCGATLLVNFTFEVL